MTSGHQHTVLVLALLVLGIRLVATQRLQKAWQAVFGTTAQAPSSSGGTRGPDTSGTPTTPGNVA